MLEGLAAWVLNTYVGEYVENLNTDQLSIALLQGAVELDNLPLKKSALKSLGLPLEVKSGFIGKITLQIPLRRLQSEPWVISIERLYLVAGPQLQSEYDDEKERAAEAARKTQLLEALEAKMQIQNVAKQSSSSWFSYGTSVLANILENLQLKIKDVHIRYEDDVTNPACPFAFGIVIKTLSAQSTDGSWVPKFVSRDNVEMMHKLVDLQNFSLYFDTNTTLVGDLDRDDMADHLMREMYISCITNLFKEHEYILSPISGTAKMKRQTTALPLRDVKTPRNAIDLNLEGMAFSLSEQQYRNMFMILREFSKYRQRRKYIRWRPNCPVKNNAKRWWRFAIDVHMFSIQDYNKRRTKSFLMQRVKDNVLYTKIYTAHLKQEVIMIDVKNQQKRIEEEMSFDELKILRDIVYKKLKKEGYFSKTPSPEPQPTQGGTSPKQEEKSVLQCWFPGWGGWYGSQPLKPENESQELHEHHEGPPAKISKIELEQELHDVMEVIGDGDDSSVLTRDAVFAKLNFYLNTGSFKVHGTKVTSESGDPLNYSILELECTGIEMELESRPRISGLKFGLGVGGLVLHDRMTENSVFPCLVSSQNKERLGVKKPAGGYTDFQKAFRIPTVPEDTTLKLFELIYEKNPFGKAAKYKFLMKTKPLDMVYNKTAFDRVRDVFSSKNILLGRRNESQLTEAARRQYETIKRQTQAEVKNSFTRLIQGTEEEQIKGWDIQLDISAPQIIIPENFQTTDTSMVVLDLGHLKFNNTAQSSSTSLNEDDEFLTPLSTPPNEPSDTASKTLDLDVLSQMNLSESELYNKLYDKYTLELTDLQVMVGKMKDNWRHIHHRGSTPLHVVDRFTISLQLERRMVFTTDPQWPTVTVSGTLPSLTIHVNEYKTHTINSCISSLSKPAHTPSTAGNQSSSFHSLSESSSGLNLEDSWKITQDEDSSIQDDGADQKLKELLEESHLVRMQFSINQMSLEIHSRDRAVAELQVSGVRTNLTKRPYDTAVTLTVHSLLVVDALQTYGQDFELLVASHKNIALDNKSGSICDSATTSPVAMSPGSPPSSPLEQLPATASMSGLQTVQDVVSRAFQSLMGDNSVDAIQSRNQNHRVLSPFQDSEALIKLEFEMIDANSPSNTNTDGPLRVANFQFNNLNIIANQETIVEILGFLKRAAPQSPSHQSHLHSLSDTATFSKSTTDLLSSEKTVDQPKLEVTAEFNRLSLLLMTLDEVNEKRVAKKVATATMSSARVQATIDSELNMTGSLGGFHVFDITPDVKRYPQVFSVGQNLTDLNSSHSAFIARDMYKTAHESMFADDIDVENRAFSFTFSKPLPSQLFQPGDSSCVGNHNIEKENCINLSLKVASLCYTHSPRTIVEISKCVAAFKDYRESFTKSIKSVASEVAKSMVAKRSELGQSSQYGSTTSLDMFTGSKYKSNQSINGIELDFLENTEPVKEKKHRIVLDASFDSPAIIVPKSATSSKVLVAHLGQITVDNTGNKNQLDYITMDDMKDKSDRIFVEMRNMNLYSVDTDKQTMAASGAVLGDKSVTHRWSFSDASLSDEAATPIMYDTLVQVTVDHFSASTNNKGSLTNMSSDIHVKTSQDSVHISQPSFLNIKAKIQTPVKLVLSKNVYEQILQTSDYLSSTDNEKGKDAKSDQNESNLGSQDIEGSLKNDSTAGSLESSVNTASSSSVSGFVTKKFRFEVPLFSVELRGDFGEGEQGIVELKLHQFLMDFLKSEAATTKVDVSLKSLSMDDLLVPEGSPHRQIMVSKSTKKDESLEMRPREFLSQSCPDNAILRPVPVMPPSLPSSLYNEGSNLDRPIYTKPFLGEAFLSSHSTGTTKANQKGGPCTPPPSPRMSRSMSCEEIVEEKLVTVSLLLVDKTSPEYKEKYNQTKRFVDVDFSCLETKINQQTWVVLLDFLGLGAKVHDIDILEGKATSPQNQPTDPDVYVQAIVNSEINFKVENLSIVLNKQEYQFAEASMSKLSSHLSLRDGNFNMTGQLGNMAILDLSPSGQLYRERFLTIGQHALEFDFFKYGVPDPMLKREFDMRLKIAMSSVRYTHTNKFQAEMLGFIQQFLQLQDILGRMRAASAGKKINEMAFHNPRLLLDIEAGSPIILIPHSSRTSDVLVADLGQLSVKNVFRFDGDMGTFNENKYDDDVTPTSGPGLDGEMDGARKKDHISRSNSETSQKSNVSSRGGGIISSRSSISQLEVNQGQASHPLTQSLFDELLPPRSNIDPMIASIYGGLDLDVRDNEEEIYDPTDFMSEGSSVDPASPRSGSGCDLSSSGRFFLREISQMSEGSSVSNENVCRNTSTIYSERPSTLSDEHTTIKSPGHRCLVDVLDVRLTDMDLFSAERVEKRQYKCRDLHQDLEFPSCIIQRQGTKLLKEKCVLNLKIERNLDGDRSHAVPDFRIEGSLSSVYCCLDIAQYKLIRGLLDHNLGEKFEPFKKELITSMQDPKIQTVLSGDVWTVIAFAVNLHNVTIELLNCHADQDSGRSEVSLAKVDLVRSRLSYESFSDQSKETDLVSHEILASDTRFRDVAINQRPSVFEKILMPSYTASQDCLQMELHFRSSLDGTRFMVILNNMKLFCSFDWLIAVQDFIATKPENPFIADQTYAVIMDEENSKPTAVSSTGKGSRTTSPVTTSGGIITKRGPIVEQTDVPFEFKLNVTDTQFVMVENLASMDSNAVILKCTSVLSYRPKAHDKLLSCTLQSLEIFSCCLQAEEETALSIVDPMSVTVELNANPLPSAKQSSTVGLMEAAVVEQKQLLLEASFSTMNVRLSYQDMKLFLAIMDSLPKQALQAKRPKTSPVSDFTESQMNELLDLGFSPEDCLKALKLKDNDVQEAAVWLTENCKLQKPKQDTLNVTQVEFTGNNFCLCLIDDCQDADVPLVELNFHGFNLKYEPGMEGRVSCLMTGDYYNRKLSGWEPLIEQWRCQAQWKNFKEPEEKLAVEISASEVLNINVTETLLDLYNNTKDKWTEDYYKQKDDSNRDIHSPSGVVRKRQMFTPYVIRNYTGSPISFIPITVSPSQVGTDSQRIHGQKMDDVSIHSSSWRDVAPNEEVPFQFLRREKIRHKKSDSFRVNQLTARVEGWQRLSPLSVDKVGVYFRDTLPDVSRPSIIKVNDQQKARVVFDISQEGSARKVITLRSALMVSNRLDGPIEVRMDNPIIPGRYDYMTVNPNQQKPIPMPFVGSRLWVRPMDWMVEYCNETILWQHVSKPGQMHATMRTCEVPESKDTYRFCVAVRREKYPEEPRLEHGLSPLPGHTLIIMPPATIKNLLPMDLRYYLKRTQICGEIKPGKEAQLHSADISSDLELGINLENFPVCRELLIPPETSHYKVKLRLYDTDNRLLELHVKISIRIGGSVQMTILAPFWLVNRSGLPLVFRQDGSKSEASGQFEEHEMARVVSPLLFSFVEKECPYLCSVRVGRYKHDRSAVPQWCKSFAFDKEATVCQLHVASKEGNRPHWVYSIGIQVEQGQGQLRNTTIVKFVPRFKVENQSEHKLAVAQRHFTNKEALKNPDVHLTALPGCIMPFHWPRQDLDQLLCVKLLDVEDCNWSGGFRIDCVNSFHVNMRDCRKNSILLKVEVLLQGQTYHILFSDAEETPPPFRLDNMSEVPVLYYQTKTQDETLRAVIRPQTCLSYAWDEPTLDPYLTLSVANGTTATYDLNKLGEGEQLCYQNFIYISATSTFSRSGSPYTDFGHRELVLDCEHDNHVIFRKKESGKRSQLWRMTSDGMLEHEGLGQPIDPRSSTKTRSGQRYVLDIADIALQPGKPVPLALKKADKTRVAKQTWVFRKGMLCLTTGNFCVQCLNGEEGLQNGAIAMLGPGPEDGRVPKHMSLSSQKLHPGSGCLTVRVIMDGPVRVLQINDISQRSIVHKKPLDSEDWEIYEESLNHKTNAKRKKPVKRNIELDLNLKGGIGISLVNSVPEELVYLVLKNITLNYKSSSSAETLEMTVADIQADNQLVSSSHTALVFVTPTTQKDVVENTHALLISAHKIPNVGWNAEIYKHVIISMKKLTMQLEEELLWKLVQFFGLGQVDQGVQKLHQGTDDMQTALSASTSVKQKRFYFGQLRVKPTCITLSVLTSAGLPPDLLHLKRSLAIRLVNFEDAKVDLDAFNRKHLFETKEFFFSEIKSHYKEELKGQAAKILGSVDFLGNPLGLVNDVAEGVSGLIEDVNVGGFAKGIFHGVSNSTAKVAGSVSDVVSNVHLDTKHNTKRHQIRNKAQSSGGHIMSGFKGLGHGVYGGIKSVFKPIEGAREGGIEGFALGLYEGLVGVVAKPVAGVLDLASGMSGAVRDASRRTSHMQPSRLRETRCCHGPGGLLPPYSKHQAKTQDLLYTLNDHCYSEIFITSECLRGTGDTLFALITNYQVFFLKALDRHKENIIMNIKHSDYTTCRYFEQDGRHYIEISRKEKQSSVPHGSVRKPQIRCDKKMIAQKVAQQLKYAKNLYDEQMWTLAPISEGQDED